MANSLLEVFVWAMVLPGVCLLALWGLSLWAVMVMPHIGW
jgi:hypothetical protein